MRVSAIRYHDISVGHKVFEQGSKCEHLHGHNYRIHFHVSGLIDRVGMVLDFGVIKEKLCAWLEENWDHKFLVYNKDPIAQELYKLDRKGVVIVPYNPTAENIAGILLTSVCPYLLKGMDVSVTKVVIEETRKCSASCEE